MKHPKKFYTKRALIKGASLIFEDWDHKPTLEDIAEQDRLYEIHREAFVKLLGEIRQIFNKRYGKRSELL